MGFRCPSEGDWNGTSIGAIDNFAAYKYRYRNRYRLRMAGVPKTPPTMSTQSTLVKGQPGGSDVQ